MAAGSSECALYLLLAVNLILFSFLAFLLLFVLIGLGSVLLSQKSTEDYLVAGKSVKPWLVGLSAIATNNSGYMFIGMIGATYADGLRTIWLMVGWIIGDFCASLIAARKIRAAADESHVQSFGGLISTWNGTALPLYQRLAGLFTLFFLTIYAGAQLKAGTKATEVLLGWPMELGIVVGAGIVLLYSAFGGIRASIWTDAAQSVVMIFGMLALSIVGVAHFGGLSGTLETFYTQPASYTGFWPWENPMTGILFFVGWFFGGAVVFGQPHVVIRYMCLDDPASINRMRAWYYGWFTFFYTFTVIVGLLSRLMFTDAESFDQELALPLMADQLLPAVFVGLILAALFAATMSTADSLILSCSAALTNDFLQGRKVWVGTAKIMTAIVLFVAMGVALWANDTVFNLVLLAWGLLGSAFTPIILMLSLRFRFTQLHAILGSLIGLSVYLLWRQFAPSYGETWYIYEVAPGVIAGLVYFAIVGRRSDGRGLMNND